LTTLNPRKYSRTMSSARFWSTGKNCSELKLAYYGHSNILSLSCPSQKHTTCGHLLLAILLSAQKALYWEEWHLDGTGQRCCADTGLPTELATVEHPAVSRHPAPLSICWWSVLLLQQSERDCTRCSWKDQ
jgi:hypothetical protein